MCAFWTKERISSVFNTVIYSDIQRHNKTTSSDKWFKTVAQITPGLNMILYRIILCNFSSKFALTN